MESVNRFKVKGKIGSIQINQNQTSGSFFINSYINKRDVNLKLLTKEPIPEGIENGDTVEVTGYITVLPPMFRAPGETYRQTFRVTSIRKCPSLLEEEFGDEGTFQSADYFYAAFKGVITNIRDEADPRWKKVTLLVDGDRHDRYPSRIAMDYQVDGNRFLSLPELNFLNGDAVEVICTITTSAKDGDRKKVHFQNLKIMDIRRTR